MAIQTGDNRFSVATWIVDPTPGYGTHTTIQGAIDDASSGDTIAIHPGTYTEDLTLKGGVLLFGTMLNEHTSQVQIDGSHTTDGSALLQGINFRTNGGTIFTNTATDASIILNNCRMELNDGAGFSINGTNAGVLASYCTIIQFGDNLKYFDISGSAVNRNVFNYCNFHVIGSTAITPSTISSGSVVFEYCQFQKQGVTASSAAYFRAFYCYFNGNGNYTYMVTSGTGVQYEMQHCYLTSGANSAVTVGAGTTMFAANVTVRSSAGSPISVAGTLNTTYTTY